MLNLIEGTLPELFPLYNHLYEEAVQMFSVPEMHLNFERIYKLCQENGPIQTMCTTMIDHVASIGAGSCAGGHLSTNKIRSVDWERARDELLRLGGLAQASYHHGDFPNHQKACASFCDHYNRFLIKCQNDFNFIVNRQMWVIIWSMRDLEKGSSEDYPEDNNIAMNSCLFDMLDAYCFLRNVFEYVQFYNNPKCICTLWSGSRNFAGLYDALGMLTLNNTNLDGFRLQVFHAAKNYDGDMNTFWRLWLQPLETIYNCTEAASHQNSTEGFFDNDPVPEYYGQLYPHNHMVNFFSILPNGK